MKKGVLLSILSVIFLCVLCYNYVIDYSSLTTDSGFDTNYSSGSSGGYNDWSPSRDTSTDRRSNKNKDDHKSYTYTPSAMRQEMVFYTIGIFFIIDLYILFLKTSWTNKSKYLLRTLPFVVIWLFSGLIITNPLSPLIAFIASMIGLFIYAFKNQNKKIVSKPKHKLSAKDKSLVDECYKVFCDVQVAWMEFDYDKMRELVTDELFNQYKNQLKQLEIKGEKNIMKGFKYLDASIVRNVNENGKRIVNIIMTVAFYDYIANQDGKVVRGQKYHKVKMTYKLTYIADEKAITICPNCAAKLEDGMTKCPYCKSTIHSTRKNLKLSSKHAIN